MLMLDDELVIETPERVELHYVLANVGNRFLAAAIDHLIQAGLGFIVLVFAGAFNSGGFFSSMGVSVSKIKVEELHIKEPKKAIVFEEIANEYMKKDSYRRSQTKYGLDLQADEIAEDMPIEVK